MRRDVKKTGISCDTRPGRRARGLGEGEVVDEIVLREPDPKFFARACRHARAPGMATMLRSSARQGNAVASWGKRCAWQLFAQKGVPSHDPSWTRSISTAARWDRGNLASTKGS